MVSPFIRKGLNYVSEQSEFSFQMLIRGNQEAI